ncbi:MAG: hydrogenase expression/formation protein HypE [Desulfurivibrionaceae bacterium]|jgi:hydrogenase expression/formation protein HypE|nr:hydrogenase expression/formation protein HypE [Desulfurivibrionaceae bacterium]MDP2757476.1 hydrogenase expression/formation protein HypE [Desulfurivibrionaceae bacterium]PKN21284.1 MAG: hydrogenase expression/formation protein HypE [Deltaproteobacteria bacterium HGW-Deltaproteobacteria-3]
MPNLNPEDFSCPLPVMEYETIQLAHGSGGRLSAELVSRFFLPRFGNETLNRLEDQAVVDFPQGRLALTTDSFVVDPLFFPGGDIGDLAINGTVNDVCMSGATPRYLAAAFIIEEGLPMATLHRILLSMEKAAKSAGVQIVTGDTKVVNRGCCDKLFITTTGVGLVPAGVNISAANLKAGDKVILSGTIADHGMAILTSREGLSFASRVQSDTAALNGLVARMLQASPAIHAMRDPTRGGIATTLNEFTAASRVGIVLEEAAIPVRPEVRGACEVLGIDPMYVANEGKLVAVVPAEVADQMVAAMRSHPLGREAAIIGEVAAENRGMVVMRNALGAQRIVDMPVGEQLPRIC